jgi:hypothetical protein
VYHGSDRKEFKLKDTGFRRSLTYDEIDKAPTIGEETGGI